MNSDDIFTLVIVIILTFVVWIAIGWENKELQNIEALPELNDVPPDEQIKYLQSLACRPYVEGVEWRRVVIGALIATFVIWLFLHYYLKKQSAKIDLVIILTFLIVITLTFYGFAVFKGHHIDRVICKKANPDLPATI